MFVLSLPIQDVNRPLKITRLQAHADRFPSIALTGRCWIDSLRAWRMALGRAGTPERFRQLQELIRLNESHSDEVAAFFLSTLIEKRNCFRTRCHMVHNLVSSVGSGLWIWGREPDLGSPLCTRDDFTPSVRSRASPQRISPPPAHVLGLNFLLSHPHTGATAKMLKEATHNATEVLSQPTKWLGMYSEFITKNSSAVSQIESALRSLTYIIPGIRW